MKDLKHPVKPLFQNESDVEAKVLANEDPDVEDYHNNVPNAETARNSK